MNNPLYESIDYGPGHVTIKFRGREGVALRHYVDVYRLAMDLCAALHKAWPEADRLEPGELARRVGMRMTDK